MKSLILMYWVILFFTQVELNKSSFDNQLIKKIEDYSYLGCARKINSVGAEYAVVTYIKQLLILSTVLGFLCYSTTKNLLITCVILILYATCLPYIVYLQKKQERMQFHISNLFSYAQTSLLLLREDKSVFELLKDCEESLEEPIKGDLKIINQEVKKTTKMIEALKQLEKKYNVSFIINVHIVMKNKYLNGYVNQALIDYLYTSIESYELAIQDFYSKWKANRLLFYLLLVLNGIAVYSLVNFVSPSVSDQTIVMQLVLFIYYFLNLVTVIFFEVWCSKKIQIE